MKCHYQVDRVLGRAQTLTVFLTPENPAEQSLMTDAASQVTTQVKFGKESTTLYTLYVVIPVRPL